MRTPLFVLLVCCAPTAVSLTPDHPASPTAPIGRLAGPPPALRPGVAQTEKAEPKKTEPKPDPHQGHDKHEHH